MASSSSRGLKRPRLFAGEAIDDLLHGELKLIQKKAGYRYSVDALLLADFVLPTIKPGHKILDIGAGSGVVSLILARRSRAKKILGVEIQESLAKMAARSVMLNQLENRIQILQLDARKMVRRFTAASFDLVLSNPPFHKLGTGVISSNRERAVARYELELNMPQLLKICARMVKPQGAIALVYPMPRLKDLIRQLDKTRLFPSRLRFVFHQKGQALPILFLIELGLKKTTLFLEPPSFIQSEKGRFRL